MKTRTYIKNAKYSFTIEGEFKKNVQIGKKEEIILKKKLEFYSKYGIFRLG